jgi:hypothetical protein
LIVAFFVALENGLAGRTMAGKLKPLPVSSNLGNIRTATACISSSLDRSRGTDPIDTLSTSTANLDQLLEETLDRKQQSPS